MKTQRIWLLAGIVACLALGPVRAFAQDDPGMNPPDQQPPATQDPGSQDIENQNVSSIDLDQADIRDAIRTLFKNVGVSFQIAQDVQGTVTLNLKNVPFRTALESILKQIDATYRIDGGVYNIIKRPDPGNDLNIIGDQGTTPAASSKVFRRIFIQHADPLIIYYMLAGLNMQSAVTLSPEMSALRRGGGGGIGGGIGGGFGGNTGGGGIGGGIGGVGGGIGGGGGLGAGGGIGGGGGGGGRGGF